MDVRIALTYTTLKGTQASFSSETMPSSQAVLLAEDLEKTGRAQTMVFLDDYDNEWTLKQLKKQQEVIQTEPHGITVYFDGGFERESKKSGLGCVIYYEQNGQSWRLRQNALVQELKTNNEAEYAALHLSIRELLLLEVHHQPVTFAGDSQVVIKQLQGEWPCYESELNRWADRIENDLHQAGIDPVYDLQSRQYNQEADWLASQALKGVDITSTRAL